MAVRELAIKAKDICPNTLFVATPKNSVPSTGWMRVDLYIY